MAKFNRIIHYLIDMINWLFWGWLCNRIRLLHTLLPNKQVKPMTPVGVKKVIRVIEAMKEETQEG